MVLSIVVFFFCVCVCKSCFLAQRNASFQIIHSSLASLLENPGGRKVLKTYIRATRQSLCFLGLIWIFVPLVVVLEVSYFYHFL